MLLNSAGGLPQAQGSEFKAPAPMQLANSGMNLNGGVPMPGPQMQQGPLPSPLPSPLPQQAQNQQQQPDPSMMQLQKNMMGFLKTDEGQGMIKQFAAGGFPNYSQLQLLQMANKAPPTSGTVNPASQMMYKAGLASTPFANNPSPQNSPVQNKMDAQYMQSLLNNPLNQM